MKTNEASTSSIPATYYSQLLDIYLRNRLLQFLGQFLLYDARWLILFSFKVLKDLLKLFRQHLSNYLSKFQRISSAFQFLY
jgi:hypothetical protein